MEKVYLVVALAAAFQLGGCDLQVDGQAAIDGVGQDGGVSGEGEGGRAQPDGGQRLRDGGAWVGPGEPEGEGEPDEPGEPGHADDPDPRGPDHPDEPADGCDLCAELPDPDICFQLPEPDMTDACLQDFEAATVYCTERCDGPAPEAERACAEACEEACFGDDGGDEADAGERCFGACFEVCLDASGGRGEPHEPEDPGTPQPCSIACEGRWEACPDSGEDPECERRNQWCAAVCDGEGEPERGCVEVCENDGCWIDCEQGGPDEHERCEEICEGDACWLDCEQVDPADACFQGCERGFEGCIDGRGGHEAGAAEAACVEGFDRCVSGCEGFEEPEHPGDGECGPDCEAPDPFEQCFASCEVDLDWGRCEALEGPELRACDDSLETDWLQCAEICQDQGEPNPEAECFASCEPLDSGLCEDLMGVEAEACWGAIDAEAQACYQACESRGGAGGCDAPFDPDRCFEADDVDACLQQMEQDFEACGGV